MTRVEHAIDTMVTLAQRMFGLMGSTIARNKAERVLLIMYAEGYIPVRRSELVSMRAELHAVETERITKVGAEQGKLLCRANLDTLLHEWQAYHDRLSTGVPAGKQRKR